VAVTSEYHFDKRAADVACAFFERLLRHTKGEWAGQPFALQLWQRDDIIRPLFGWKRADGTRKYRRAYIEIPRKNGKSTLSAGIALALLLMDNEPGAEVYSAAADRNQAAIVFDAAKTMVEGSTALARFAEVYRREIRVPKINGIYRVLSADAPTKHGLNAHGVIFDELHAQPNRELWDVLVTSTGARRQPMLVAITTAGYDRNSICWEQHEYARQVSEGLIDDPAFFAYIAAADPGDDWADPVTWAKANPGLGVTVKVDYLAGEVERAKASPAYQNAFRRLHLNQWTSQESRFIDMTAWDACNTPLPDLSGRACMAGLDLASTTDLAALVLVFPPKRDNEPYWVLPRFYIPAQNMIERVRRDRVPYDVWVRQGLIVATEGNVIDYAAIRQDLAQLGAKYKLQEIAFDPWNATQFATQLEEDGFVMVQFRQGFASMSGPTKELLRLVLSEDLAHGGNAVLRWMADNLAVRQDPAGNIKPDKAKSTQRIDGMVALVMATGRALSGGESESVYEGQGIRMI
jgi:phage terminase large subunit-like protein